MMGDKSPSDGLTLPVPGSFDDLSADLARAEALLAHGEVARDVKALLWGSNYASLVAVQGAEGCVLAVYKPQRGERSLWDFPDGTLCCRELLAYHVAKALGWNLVPPTVLREGPLGLGSVQLFIVHSPEVTYFGLDDRFAAQLRRFAVFDFIVNNADRKGGHLLLDVRGKLWGIDHGLTFHAAPKLRTVIWEFAGQPVEESWLHDVEVLCEQLAVDEARLVELLRRCLTPREVLALRRRVEWLLREKRFPVPGRGPVVPWPPV
ncbi:MAG: SCO1664 family protein [Anaerolineae bacterium]|nr:SCO1664 family protein [Anaerolineae bacterium]